MYSQKLNVPILTVKGKGRKRKTRVGGREEEKRLADADKHTPAQSAAANWVPAVISRAHNSSVVLVSKTKRHCKQTQIQRKRERVGRQAGRQPALIEVKMSPESANLYNTAHRAQPSTAANGLNQATASAVQP